MAVSGFGLLWIVVASYGWFWLVVGGCSMVLASFGWFWLVLGFTFVNSQLTFSFTLTNIKESKQKLKQVRFLQSSNSLM